MSTKTDSPLLCFCHVPKTAGRTMVLLLRRNFGWRHIDVINRFPRDVRPYRARDLSFDLKLHPTARSVGGHGLRPWHDMGEFEHRLQWFTILRDPIKRFVSRFQYGIEQMGEQPDFNKWARQRGNVNAHVWWLSGGQDLDLAKEILATKFCAVGLMERFNESLLVLRQRAELEGFDVAYTRPANVHRSSARRDEILEQVERHSDLIEETNRLDIELYRFAVEEIWPKQVEAYGKTQLEVDLRREFASPSSSISERARLFHNRFHRNIFYKPYVRLDKLLHPIPQGVS